MRTFLKNKISKGLFIATLATSTFSCQTDLLNPVPQTNISDLVVFDSPERILQGVNGLYSGLKNGQFLGGRAFVYGDIRSDNFLNETTNGVTGLETWRHTELSSTNEVVNLWSAAYTAINRANLFLEGIDENASKYTVPLFPADFATVTVNQYKGEARFVRALAYLHLVQLFCKPYADGNGSAPGLPLRLIGEKSSLNNDLARSTVGEVYAQILADLDFAEQNLPAGYTGIDAANTAYLRTTRAHKHAAIALKTRVYLNMGQYANVITEANKIVSTNAPFVAPAANGVAHQLMPAIGTVFSAPYTSLESIFSMPFTTANLPGTQNGLGSYYNPGPAGIGDYSLNPAKIYGDNVNWPAADARRAMTSVAATKPYLRKFPAGPQHTDYAPVIRYAEVLLNLSEAIARTTAGVDARALALVNAVRQRSHAAFTHAPVTNADLITAIMLERNIELIGEGFRTNDFMRLLQPIPGKGTITDIPSTAAIYSWPIPITELNTNKLMTPNN
jgi:starch-binding outer membrane protein, SusD/RagB family